MCVQSEISFLEGDIFSAITKRLALKGGATGMTCDLTHSLGAHPGPVFSKHRCDGKNLQCTFCVNGRRYLVYRSKQILVFYKVKYRFLRVTSSDHLTTGCPHNLTNISK